ncbi:MAG: GIY-YIG nuclease family protein [Bacteroidota bacterium]|nr:GIY-YIG nuclease family protein [Bacteroidota bacterium]
MSSYCYMLYSKSLDRYYIGATQDDLDLRIEKHNESAYGKHRFTATAKDWELFIKIPTKDYAHAIRLERLIKSMKSSKYIRNLKQYPELVEKILNNTST